MTHPLQLQPSAPQTAAIGWTPERKARFLQALSNHGNARAACRFVRMSAESAYKLRRREPLFARAWAAAVVLGRDASIEALGERAIEGVEEEIYYRGELIGTRRRYDSRLLLAHLARLDRLADEASAGEDVGRFDELVACVAEDSQELMPPRGEYIEDAAVAANNGMRERQMEDHPELFDEALGDLTDDEDEQLESLNEACDEAAERAAEEAGKEWDERLVAAYASIDALGDTRQDVPGIPAGAGMHAPAGFGTNGASEPTSLEQPGRESSLPCTLSTVSTSALATAMVGLGDYPHPPGEDRRYQ